MLSVANLAREKLQLSNLPDEQRELQRQALAFQRARAHWIAGELPEARAELEAMRGGRRDKKKTDPQVDRLYEILRLSPETPS